ncbi:MAG: hypothetical protein KC503_07655 [Myxococcales bacterium]|nr:hypothetical protein [Myxococcales bacterium]
MRTHRVLLLSLSLLLLPLAATAQQKKKPDAKALEQAKKYATQADTFFSLGFFEKAAAAYQKAYVIKQAPALLYNIGQCYKRMGGIANLEKALFYYESYLNNLQAERQREKLSKRIDKLKGELKRLKAERDKGPPIYKRWWFWTAIGVVVAGATVGTVLALQPEDQKVVRGTVDPDIFELP